MNFFVGIDPGQTGGIGILDGQGRFVAAHRWDKRDPKHLYDLLYYSRGIILRVYIENVNLPQTGAGLENKFCGSGNLLVNVGIWQGFLIALDIRYDEIAPQTWQAAVGLHRWKKAWQGNHNMPSPLSVARSRWPGAPLEFAIDDGKAVGLILASLALEDYQKGIDRGQLKILAQKKAKLKKQAKKRQGNIIASP